MARTESGYDAQGAKLPEFLLKPTLKDTIPGSVVSVDDEHLFIDGSSKCWIDGDATYKSSEDAWEDELTVVRINEGFVIDLSREPKEGRFEPTTAMEIITDASDNLQPVVGFIISEKDLLDFDKQYHGQTGERYLTKEERKHIKKRIKKSRKVAKVAVNQSD